VVSSFAISMGCVEFLKAIVGMSGRPSLVQWVILALIAIATGAIYVADRPEVEVQPQPRPIELEAVKKNSYRFRREVLDCGWADSREVQVADVHQTSAGRYSCP
jgi:hypothetical protein